MTSFTNPSKIKCLLKSFDIKKALVNKNPSKNIRAEAFTLIVHLFRGDLTSLKKIIFIVAAKFTTISPMEQRNNSKKINFPTIDLPVDVA